MSEKSISTGLFGFSHNEKRFQVLHLMGKMADNWANAYRNWRAWFMAILMCLLLAWIFLYDAVGPSLVNRSSVEMVVVGLSENARAFDNASQPIIYTIELESEDRQIIKTTTGARPVPKIGDKLPVIVELYDDDKALYFIDQNMRIEQQFGM